LINCSAHIATEEMNMNRETDMKKSDWQAETYEGRNGPLEKIVTGDENSVFPV
jgi:hypothetical protein